MAGITARATNKHINGPTHARQGNHTESMCEVVAVVRAMTVLCLCVAVFGRFAAFAGCHPKNGPGYSFYVIVLLFCFCSIVIGPDDPKLVCGISAVSDCVLATHSLP